MMEHILLGSWAIAMLLVIGQLYRWHMSDDPFDLRKFVTSPDANGKEQPDLSKLILVVAVFASTYYLISGKTSAEVLAVYLGAWVLNKAVSVGGRVLPTMFNSTTSSTTIKSREEIYREQS